MKKAFLLATILLISVITTACINNFAIQELNNKAKIFMEKGDYTSAIERLKSSVDLDASIFETQYNLAVAYTKAEDYFNAIKTYDDASKLNPDFADLYYSRAVCEENLAKDIISGKYTVDDEGNISEQKEEDVEKKQLSASASKAVLDYINLAVEDYTIFADKSQTNDIQDKLDELKKLSEDYVK